MPVTLKPEGNIMSEAIRSEAMMRRPWARFIGWIIGCWLASGTAALAADDQPILPSLSDKTITLTGHDLTIEQVVDVARYGAKVQLSPEARQREADNYGLLLEAAAEGIAVYWFNRGAGDQRETVMFSGDPLSPENKRVSRKEPAAGISARRDPRASDPRSATRRSCAR